jgi:DNA-binding transcriptional LysR family regulator
MSSTDEAMEALIGGAAEISFILNPPFRDAIASTEVFRDTMVAAVAPSHPLAKRKIISLHDLAEFPFILAEASFGLRQQVDRAFDRHRFQPKVFCVTNSIALIKALGSIGRQCTLLPRFVVQQEAAAGTLSTIAVREFAADPLVFCVCARKDRTMSPAANAFVEAVADYCRRYGR